MLGACSAFWGEAKVAVLFSVNRLDGVAIKIRRTLRNKCDDLQKRHIENEWGTFCVADAVAGDYTFSLASLSHVGSIHD